MRLRYEVRAVGVGHGRAQRAVILQEAAASAKPPTADLAVSPRTLPYSGGRPTLTYSSSNAKSCSLSASPKLWSGNNPRSVSCKGTTELAGIAANAAASGKQWTITFEAKSSAGKIATATGTLTEQAQSISESENWSGYVVPSTSGMTEASGRFRVPTLNCAKTPDAIEAGWVGIGGAVGTEDLLQTGVASECVNGAQTNDAAWWELAPELPSVDFTDLTVSAGDEIEASVSQQAGGAWMTRVDDLSTGISGEMITGDAYGTVVDSNPSAWRVEEGSTGDVSYTGGSTAEWIVEDPATSDDALVPFADYGTVAFSDLTTNLSTWSLTPSEELEIVQGDSVLSVPSAPSGKSFSVAFTG